MFAFSKCKPYLWCVVLGVASYHIDTYACCHVAKRPKLVKTGGCTGLEAQGGPSVWLGRSHSPLP